MTALGVTPSPENGPLIMGMRAIAALGLATIPLNYVILKRLIAMVETVRAGEPSLQLTPAVCKPSPGPYSGCRS
jgi:hypothetical protein